MRAHTRTHPLPREVRPRPTPTGRVVIVRVASSQASVCRVLPRARLPKPGWFGQSQRLLNAAVGVIDIHVGSFRGIRKLDRDATLERGVARAVRLSKDAAF